jgi:hypothetical protein
MTVLNPYFTQGTTNEQSIIEDLINESIKIYGVELNYLPRTLIAKDEILGEDRLSKFNSSYSIPGYFENVNNFGGNDFFIQKFGMMVEHTADIIVTKRDWERLVGRFDVTNIPNRPNEGDLIYFPLTKGLFEIKFVDYKPVFYQLGKLYVYKLQIELFQYASEHLDTGIEEIDMFESLKTYSTDIEDSDSGGVFTIEVTNGGINYTHATVNILSNTGTGAVAEAILVDGVISTITVIDKGSGYKDVSIIITGDGTNATAIGILKTNVDLIDSYGDNNKLKERVSDIVDNSEHNAFGFV